MIIGSITIILIALLIVLMVVFAIVAPIIVHLPQFGRHPKGKRLERIRKSPNYRKGCFRNLNDVELRISFHQSMKLIRHLLFGKKKALVPSQPLTMAHEDLKHLSPDHNYYIWFGHSSYLLSLHGKTILVDPVFCVAAPFAFVNRPFVGTDVYQPEDMPDIIDCLLITHDHYDHLDHKTFLRLKDRVQRVVCPLGVGAHLERWGMDMSKVTELDWDEELLMEEGWKWHCLPSQHFSGRALRRNNTLWASFLLDSPFGRLFLGCDGGYGPHFKTIGEKFPDIDLAVLENGQYNEHWNLIHTMPDELGKEAQDLHARQVITVHHSKYALARHSWDEPLENERKASEESGFDLIVPKLGAVQEILR